jgi:histidyl-tRNA synthetase
LSPPGLTVWKELAALRDGLRQLHPGIQVDVDLSIARGFDYYTGIVFEIFDTHPENRRALFGGGRYDNLTSAFGTDPLPGVGFGVSDVALLNFCETRGIKLAEAATVDVAVVRFSSADRLAAFELAAAFRSLDLICTAPLTEQKFGKQIQAAERMGARAIAFRGEAEMAQNTFCIKWLGTGEQVTFEMTPVGLQQFSTRLKAAK